ncbi:MAG: tetratricopeptide repeat protein [Candidatus Poribacteria bacterium]|nr:tetratricopeptide repeat protein [Candidatus Poribacteria bacterium]
MTQNNRLTQEVKQEDKFITLVLDCYTFLKDNARTISIVVAVSVVGVVGYLAYTQNQEKKHAEASTNFSLAAETYRDAETNYFTVSAPSENEDDTEDETSEEKTSFEDAEEKLQIIFDKYANTALADKARYKYAKSLYFQGKYPEARTEFTKVIETHQPENQIYALYAQKALGNCLEQESDYVGAIAAYDGNAFPDTPQLAPEIRQYVITNAKYNQALCQEKLNNSEDAKSLYKEIIDEFKTTVNYGIEQRSIELINDAKEVIVLIEDSLDISGAEGKESDQLYFEALVNYTDTIQAYKVKKDVEGGISSDTRERIRKYEDLVTTVISNVKSAQKSEKSGFLSSALNSYDDVVDFKKYGLSRELYENALLHYNRLSISE